MNNKQSQLSKKCVACGLQKPLPAFMQIKGAKGTTYGNVCATCRGSGLGKKIILPTEAAEGSGSTTVGLKIDAKTKAYIDQKNEEKAQKKEHTTEEEHKKDEEKIVKDAEKTEAKEKTERKHREEFIERKTSFLDKPITKSADPKKYLTDKEAIKQGIKKENQHLDASLKEENLVKTTDFSTSFWDPGITGEIKYTSPEFMKIRSWLGESAAVNRLRTILNPQNSAEAKANPNLPQNKIPPENKPIQQSKPASEEQKLPRAVDKTKPSSVSTFSSFSQSPVNVQQKPDQSPVIDYITEKWKPSSSKR